MTLSSFLIFVPACIALNLIPGPNNVLSINNATRFGARPAVLAGTGRLVAFAGMIILASMGQAAVLAGSAIFFTVLKVFGGLYLIWIAVVLWRTPTQAIDLSDTKGDFDVQKMARQEFVCAASNPKAILIFTAIFPQFLNTNETIAPQFFIMGATFLVFEWFTILMYATLAAQLRRVLSSASGQRRFNRASAGVLGMVGAALLGARA